MCALTIRILSFLISYLSRDVALFLPRVVSFLKLAGFHTSKTSLKRKKYLPILANRNLISNNPPQSADVVLDKARYSHWQPTVADGGIANETCD